jgi:hypothetical protein
MYDEATFEAEQKEIQPKKFSLEKAGTTSDTS